MNSKIKCFNSTSQWCVAFTISIKTLGKILSATMLCALPLLLHSPAIAQEKNIYQNVTVGNQLAKSQIQTSTSPKQDHAHALKLARSEQFNDAANILAPYARQPMAYVLITGDYLVFLGWAGKNRQATDAFERLPATFPKSVYLLRNMAKAYYNQHHYLPAASLYAETVKQTPEDIEAQKGHVLSLHYAGKAEESNARLNEYLKANPDSLALQSIRPQVLISGGVYAKAWAIQADLLRRKGASSTEQHRAWESLIASVPTDKRKAMVEALRSKAASGEISDIENYILVLALHREFTTLITSYESTAIKPDHFLIYTTYWIGWAYFKADKLKQSEALYRNLLAREPKELHGTTGLAYVLGKQRKPEQAFKLLKQLSKDKSHLAEIHFARAYVYEQQSDYWSAIKEYDAILAVYPHYRTAKKLKLMAMSALGASSQALKLASDDSELQAYIQGNMAIDRMQWGEFKQSLVQLDPLLKRRDATGSKFDRIIVLVEDLQMKQAITEYDKLKAEGATPPYWVMDSVGSAYVYLEEWEKALAVFEQELKTDPKLFDARMGKLYSLSELRRWREAEETLNTLERDVIPEKGRSPYTEDQQMEVVVAHGWFLIDQNMLHEADTYFTNYYEKAPANTEVRSGLAHTHHFRGWPRKALREFQTITSMESRDINPGPRVGHAQVLNELAYKEEARDMINKHRAQYPRDKHGIRVARELEVDEIRELNIGLVYEHSNDGFNDFFSFAEYKQPISLYTDLLAMVSYRRSSQNELSTLFHRAGLGFEHTFNSDWFIREVVSLDVNEGREFGSQTTVRYTPTDHWIFEGMYDSFTIDVPMRARVASITSDLASLDVTYRESERREYGLGGSYSGFSDGSKRMAATARFEQELLAEKDWRMRLIVDGYLGSNSLDTASYFNPSRDWSASATLMIEQTIWHRYESIKGYYDRGFIHRLYLTSGIYGQQNFSSTFLGSVRYEQELDFSDTHHLLWGVTTGLHAYDGIGVTNYSIDALYRWLF